MYNICLEVFAIILLYGQSVVIKKSAGNAEELKKAKRIESIYAFQVVMLLLNCIYIYIGIKGVVKW